MSQAVIDVIGAGAAICSTTSFAPQLVKLWRDKRSGEVSLGMYLLTVGAFALWSAYGLMLNSWPLVAANLVSLGLASAILILQLRYRDRAGRPADPPRPGRRTDPPAS